MLACPGGQGRFLRPILASFAVVGEVEGALGIIKQVKERQLAAEGESLGDCSWHAAVSHCSLLFTGSLQPLCQLAGPHAY